DVHDLDGLRAIGDRLATGVVQSVAFPSAAGTGTPVIVRLAFDADRPELPVSLMDTITRSIRPIGDSATNGGVGSTIGP
ncbi:hypothetical protein I3W98_40410, partial [Streptomyces cavourensis]|nr:hypothetical protein [Streptomyces cavourensis]